MLLYYLRLKTILLLQGIILEILSSNIKMILENKNVK